MKYIFIASDICQIINVFTCYMFMAILGLCSTK